LGRTCPRERLINIAAIVFDLPGWACYSSRLKRVIMPGGMSKRAILIEVAIETQPLFL
jgi:hypothetical protein